MQFVISSFPMKRYEKGWVYASSSLYSKCSLWRTLKLFGLKIEILFNVKSMKALNHIKAADLLRDLRIDVTANQGNLFANNSHFDCDRYCHWKLSFQYVQQKKWMKLFSTQQSIYSFNFVKVQHHTYTLSLYFSFLFLL